MMTHQELLRWFHKEFPNHVADMHGSDHNLDSNNLNPYHMEGSCWTHTMMVLSQAVQRGYDFETQLACLLHDLGKPVSRILKGDKVTFYNHDPVSAYLALEVMDRLKLPNDVRERVFKVIALHTEVFKRPLQELYELIGDDKIFFLLMNLAECDHNGRFTDVPSDINYDFAPLIVPRKGTFTKNKNLVVLTGLPYSGKSTFVENLKDRSILDNKTFIVSRDYIIDSLEGVDYNDKWNKANQDEVNKQLELMFKESKSDKYDNVIVDMTHMSEKSRRKTLSHYNDQYYKLSISFLPPMNIIDQRRDLRIGKEIPLDVEFNMVKSFRPPFLSEGFDRVEYKF